MNDNIRYKFSSLIDNFVNCDDSVEALNRLGQLIGFRECCSVLPGFNPEDWFDMGELIEGAIRCRKEKLCC